MYTVHIEGMPYAAQNLDKVVANALRIDAEFYTQSQSQQNGFIKSNDFGYTVAITLWLCQVAHINERAADVLRSRISRFGLRYEILNATTAADQFVKNKFDTQAVNYPWSQVIRDTYSRCSTSMASVRTSLQVMRFLKRFTPTCTTTLADGAKSDFIDTQVRLRRHWSFQHMTSCHMAGFVLDEVADAITDLIQPKKYALKKLSAHNEYCYGFTPGAHLGCTSIAEKAWALLTSNPNALCGPVSNSILWWDIDSAYRKLGTSGMIKTLTSKQDAKDLNFDGTKLYDQARDLYDWRLTNMSSVRFPDTIIMTASGYNYRMATPGQFLNNCNVMKSVPKNYKTNRLIAPEHTLRQWQSGEVAAFTEDCFTPLAKRIIPLHDQGENQNFAMQGSMCGSKYATIDQSSASDSLSEWLFQRVFPHWYTTICNASGIRSTHTYISRGARIWKRVGLMTHLTSGNSCTFIHESILFAAICIAAIKIHSRLCGESIPSAASLGTLIRCYGDDITIPSKYVDVLQYCLTTLGFIMNDEKSFYSLDNNPAFRESCGVEFFDGEELSTSYWPRKVITLDKECTSLPSLISLQHQMWIRGGLTGNDPATRYITAVCKAVCPKLSTVDPFTDGTALWDTYHKRIFTQAPLDITKFPVGFKDELNSAIRKANALGTANIGDVPIEFTPSAHAPLPWEIFLREVTYQCVVDDPVVDFSLFKYGYTKALDLYQIYLFLKKGPMFDSALDELLGVSTPRRTLYSMTTVGPYTNLKYKVKRLIR